MEVPMPEKIDLSKELKHLYAPSPKEPVIVDVPPLNFLALDGSGDPNNSPLYQETVQSLYSLSYGLKFAIKKAGGPEYQVMPLEGLWWAEDMSDFITRDKQNWIWTMLIAQPAPVTPEWLETVRAATLAKKDAAPRVAEVRWLTYTEGLSVQLMHLGPYSAEGPNIQRMHQFAFAQGYRLEGKHHEIYLGDPRRTAPEKLRTVLRQPITR
jgi:hypothetical protein